MGSRFAEASVAIGASLDKHDWMRAKSDITSSVRGIGTSISGILGPALAASLGAAGIGAALSKTIGLAREQLQAERKLGAVLKATGNAAGFEAAELKELASSLQKVTNYGDETTLSAMAVLATFKEVKGSVFKDAIKAAQDMASVLGGDLQGAILQIGKSLNDPIKGITALSRAGVSFTEQQKAQIKALQESGDLMGAQKIILAELKGEFGGAAEELADPFIQMKNAIGDASEAIGLLLMPKVNELATATKEVAEGWPTLMKGFELRGLQGKDDKTVADWNRIEQLKKEIQAEIGSRPAGKADPKWAEAAAKFTAEMGRAPAETGELVEYMNRLDTSTQNVATSAGKMGDALSKALGDVADELRTAGMGDMEKKLDALRQAGASDSQLDDAFGMLQDAADI